MENNEIKFKNSRPCANCMAMIKFHRIKKVYYTTGGSLDNISYKMEKVSEMESDLISFGNLAAFNS